MKLEDLINLEYCENAGANTETLETAGCDGQCPTYPGAPRTKDGFPDCSKCPNWEGNSK